MRDVEVQKLMDVADELRNNGKHQEAIKHYLDAMKTARKDLKDGIKDELWQKKVIFMACNGMGIAYAKLGKVTDAIDNFVDAVSYAPTEEAKRTAKSNLGKYQKTVKDKTDIDFVSHFIG
jgi:tetratricopeptide (TPR) repeat protein